MNKLEESQKQVDQNYTENEQQVLADAENIINKINDTKPKKNTKVFRIILIIIFIMILIALFFSTIFALLNTRKTTIIDGVFVENIDVSNLTKDEAKEKLLNNFSSKFSKELTLKHGDYSTTIIPIQLNVSCYLDDIVDSAYSMGRSNNIFNNNYIILNAMFMNTHIKSNISFDKDLLNSMIEQINKDIPNAVVQPDYSIDGDSLIISNGKDGIVVDAEKLSNNILDYLNNFTDSVSSVMDIPVKNTSAKKIDIDAIYKDIHKDAVDAYYTTNPYVVHPSSTGLDFDISVDDAKAMILTQQDTYTIPLKTIYPNVTTNQIGTEAFPDLLSEFSTSFASSNYNRSTNIYLASAKINGVVLMPGEIFSYNQVVGQRTAAAGFKQAPAYLSGKVVQEYGGGICQVSSTLYNAVLYSNLEVVERSNHAFKPSYVKPGLDATVSWGGPDFKFKNNRNYPIKIVCDTSGKNIHMYIFGLKMDSDCKVVLDAKYLSTVAAQTVYQTDSSLAPGETKVIQSASNGCKTATYKLLYDTNGNLVSNECISRDTYSAHNKIIAVGR